MAEDTTREAQAASDPVAALMTRVGDRVRQVREQRGMPRRVLSEISGVSPRYLAQLESGEGNISIGLLMRVAAALDDRIDWLMGEEDPWTSEMLNLAEIYRRADPAVQGRVRGLLLEGAPGGKIHAGPVAGADRGGGVSWPSHRRILWLSGCAAPFATRRRRCSTMARPPGGGDATMQHFGFATGPCEAEDGNGLDLAGPSGLPILGPWTWANWGARPARAGSATPGAAARSRISMAGPGFPAALGGPLAHSAAMGPDRSEGLIARVRTEGRVPLPRGPVWGRADARFGKEVPRPNAP